MSDAAATQPTEAAADVDPTPVATVRAFGELLKRAVGSCCENAATGGQ